MYTRTSHTHIYIFIQMYGRTVILYNSRFIWSVRWSYRYGIILNRREFRHEPARNETIVTHEDDKKPETIFYVFSSDNFAIERSTTTGRRFEHRVNRLFRYYGSNFFFLFFTLHVNSQNNNVINDNAHDTTRV